MKCCEDDVMAACVAVKQQFVGLLMVAQRYLSVHGQGVERTKLLMFSHIWMAQQNREPCHVLL